MAGEQQNPTSETEEIRDADEVREQAMRGGLSYAMVPIGENGRPMRRIKVGVSDKIPTVQFGNVVLTVEIEEWAENLGSGPEGRQHRVDVTRELHRDAQFALGVERRLLQWALDPAAKVASPITGDDVFAAPPPGYDHAKAPVDPRVVAEQQAAAQAAAAAPPAPPASS